MKKFTWLIALFLLVSGGTAQGISGTFCATGVNTKIIFYNDGKVTGFDALGLTDLKTASYEMLGKDVVAVSIKSSDSKFEITKMFSVTMNGSSIVKMVDDNGDWETITLVPCK